MWITQGHTAEMTPLFLDSLVLSLQTLGCSPKEGPWDTSSSGYQKVFGVGHSLEGGEPVSVIRYVGNANLSHVALSPSETSQKLTYPILLGSSQDSSSHMRIPVENDWLQSMGSQRVRHDWASELNSTDGRLGTYNPLNGLELPRSSEGSKRAKGH